MCHVYCYCILSILVYHHPPQSEEHRPSKTHQGASYDSTQDLLHGILHCVSQIAGISLNLAHFGNIISEPAVGI